MEAKIKKIKWLNECKEPTICDMVFVSWMAVKNQSNGCEYEKMPLVFGWLKKQNGKE